MKQDIYLYPTETLYALGVNALDEKALARLYKLKGREKSKASSWLVRDIADVESFAEVPEKARQIAERFLPGPLTLVLQVKDNVHDGVVASDRTIGFRISSDPIAQKLIGRFMEEHDTPLTCTSANVSGAPVFPTVNEILQQLGTKSKQVTEIIDDGPRKSLASTVVRVIGDDVTVLREGSISEREILSALQ